MYAGDSRCINIEDVFSSTCSRDKSCITPNMNLGTQDKAKAKKTTKYYFNLLLFLIVMIVVRKMVIGPYGLKT